MSEHRLKCWPGPYEDVESELKTFEIREAVDRKFLVGDILRLEEFKPCRHCKGTGRVRSKFKIDNGTVECACMGTEHPKGKYTGSFCLRRVTHILDGGFGLKKNHVAMSIVPHPLNPESL